MTVPLDVSNLKSFLKNRCRSSPTFSIELEEVADTPPTDQELINAGLKPGDYTYGAIGLEWANKIVRRKRDRLFRAKKDELPVIVAEGDSWFLHPLVADVIDHLSHSYAVKSLAAAGDTCGDMEEQGEILAALASTEARVLLFSGGGNDLLGTRFGEWLVPYHDGITPQTALNEKYLAMLDTVMESYRTILGPVVRTFPQVRILLHCYDYVIPRSGNDGKWLGGALEEKGFPDDRQRLKRDIVKRIVDDFHGKLEQFITLQEFVGHAEVVNTRNTVGEERWYDEIHPAAEVYEVAQKFAGHISDVLDS